ncbi:MAG: protein O-mannosyl-transferase family [Candidatus Aphodosoma sp.]
MKKFKLYNNIVGWTAFAIAAVTYLLTIEPTGSFWDCGEFISSAFKLEVGHPPGAPFFMLTARMFSLLASDPSQVAAMVNSMSALCSAFTILFLFWSITHIARRIVVEDGKEMTLAQGIAILGSGLVGALAYTFSDTFWFSAVEGEVYAYSSLFTAVVFWCILKWEDVAEQPASARWIILIAYLMGLSIGVHLLNLLAIPAIVLIYYFRNYQVTWKNTLIALVAAVVILASVLYGMVPGFVKVASWFELFFVNVCGLGFNSGVLIYITITAAILIWAIYETQTVKNTVRARIAFVLALSILGIPFFGNGVILGLIIIAGLCTLLFVRKEWNYRWLNTIVLCATVMLIGYSTYTMIVVRSLANTPMDQNSPEDVFALQSYLNREQYGDRPLFYGAMYPAPEVLEIKGNLCIPIARYNGTLWQQEVKTSDDQPDRYRNAGQKMAGYEMDSRFKMLFPRMYSSQPHHVAEYKNWADIKGDRITVDRCGRTETLVMPTFGENLRFFFSYQVNFMYWRYFMWNFAGRQNDIQGHGEIDCGNWISGIPFIDNARLGDQDALPEVLKNNKGHNRYFMLPLLLGLLGMVWQLVSRRRGIQQFWVVMALFFMTGLAIVIYLNQTPLQPRERDYAYAGSFYAFSIWIGLGVMMLYSLVEKYIPKPLAAAIVSLLCLGVPVLMAHQNWDDHDRSNRTMARDFGLNYLNTCEENAIIFSNGDNDTFPLWYNQEVEGKRTDMRVCNLSYIQTDWYIDQMKRGAYESAPLPIAWEKKDYIDGHLDVSRVTDHPQLPHPLDINTAFSLLRDPRFIDEDGIGNLMSTTLSIPVNKQAVIESGTVAAKDSASIADNMYVTINKRQISKSQLMVLEILRSNNWQRPVYIASTVGTEFYPALKDYMVLEGLAYRIVPVKNTHDNVNTERMFDNMMNRFEYGDLGNPKVYLDEQHLRMARTMRLLFMQLTNSLISEGETEKAGAAIKKYLEVLPVTTIPFDYTSAEMAKYCYQLNMKETGDMLARGLKDQCVDNLEWYVSLSPEMRRKVSADMQPRQHVGLLQNMWFETRNTGNPIADELEELLQKYYYLVQNER